MADRSVADLGFVCSLSTKLILRVFFLKGLMLVFDEYQFLAPWRLHSYLFQDTLDQVMMVTTLIRCPRARATS